MAGNPIPRPPRPRWHSETLLRPQTRVNDGQSKTKCYSKAAKAKSRMSRTEERTHKRSVARIQRLCYLGLGGEAIAPELMRELDALVPSHLGHIRWFGRDMELEKVYGAFAWPADVHELYVQEFHNKREPEVVHQVDVRRQVRRPYIVDKVDYTTSRRSDFVNLILRPCRIDSMAVISISDTGRGHIEVRLPRGLKGESFSTKDLRQLQTVAGFVAHGMVRVPRVEQGLGDDDDRGILITTAVGRPRHASGHALELLSMAVNAKGYAISDLIRSREIVPELAQLCGRLWAVVNGATDHPPPVLRTKNPWGEFALRGYWLEPTDGTEPTQHVVISIERRVPRPLAMRRRIEGLQLTAREKQLCLLLAADPVRSDLARTMGIGETTLTTHLRNIHAKLGVHNRAELHAALLPQ
jgi:DNA-binding CsgD family transcriptional regulator